MRKSVSSALPMNLSTIERHEMKLEDRFFPRVWDGKRYWYPCFSELGITYEGENLPFCEENIRSLDWALSWHFSQNGEHLDFVHIVEACTGLRDKKGNLIYESDIVEYKISGAPSKSKGIVHYDMNQGVYLKGSQFLSTYPKTILIIGNINENPELKIGTD